MSAISTTYAFASTAGSLTNPILAGAPIVFAGEIGMGEFSVTMDTERTAHDTAADGTVMPSYIAGDSGRVTIRVQQTSILHTALLTLYNLLKTAADSGNATNWAASSLSIQNVTTRRQHNLSGVSFSKIPDYPYAAQGQSITWVLMAASVQNL